MHQNTWNSPEYCLTCNTPGMSAILVIHQNTAILVIHQNTCNTPGYCLELVGKVHCTETGLPMLYNVAAHTFRKPTPITAHINNLPFLYPPGRRRTGIWGGGVPASQVWGPDQRSGGSGARRPGPGKWSGLVRNNKVEREAAWGNKNWRSCTSKKLRLWNVRT